MKKPLMHKAAITISSHPMYLSIVRVFLEKLLKLMDLPTYMVEDLKSAVDEACSNVIKYAYKNDYERTIKVSFECTSDKVEVVIEDRGEKPADTEFQGRDLRDLKPGGLGMHFIRKAFDEIRFRRIRGINKLTLMRRL